MKRPVLRAGCPRNQERSPEHERAREVGRGTAAKRGYDCRTAQPRHRPGRRRGVRP
jgi:hypothetical protein